MKNARAATTPHQAPTLAVINPHLSFKSRFVAVPTNCSSNAGELRGTNYMIGYKRSWK